MAQVINLFTREELEDPAEADAPLVAEVLHSAVSELLEMTSLKEFILIATDLEEDVYIRSSDMTRKEALWLLELARDHAKQG